MGLKFAIKWLSELHIQSITIELDSLPVVNGMKGSTKLNSDLGSILLSCKMLLSRFQSYRINYVRRHANHVAHTLARASGLYASSQVFDFSPTCNKTILMNEMN